jgi:hypothetical protein
MPKLPRKEMGIGTTGTPDSKPELRGVSWPRHVNDSLELDMTQETQPESRKMRGKRLGRKAGAPWLKKTAAVQQLLKNLNIQD